MTTINAKELRASLPEVVERVRRRPDSQSSTAAGRRFQIVPVDESAEPRLPLEADSL